MIDDSRLTAKSVGTDWQQLLLKKKSSIVAYFECNFNEIESTYNNNNLLYKSRE